MRKDRAAPFSRKHKRYWIPIAGGMLLICILNLAVGIYLYSNRPKSYPRPTIDAGAPRQPAAAPAKPLPDQLER